MTLAILGTMVMAGGITFNPGSIANSKTFKVDFQLRPPDKNEVPPQTFKRFRFRSGIRLPAPIRIQWHNYLPDGKSRAPFLEPMFMTMISSHDPNYSTSNLKKVTSSDWSFKCSVKGDQGDFSLTREGGQFLAKGTISITVLRDVLPVEVELRKDGSEYYGFLPIGGHGYYIVSASMKAKVANTQAPVPSRLGLKHGNSSASQESNSPKITLLASQDARGESVAIRLKPKVVLPDMRHKLTVTFLPAFEQVAVSGD